MNSQESKSLNGSDQTDLRKKCQKLKRKKKLMAPKNPIYINLAQGRHSSAGTTLEWCWSEIGPTWSDDHMHIKVAPKL